MNPDGLISAVGPARCDILLVGEAGGQTEHRTGRPFAGKAGAVLTTYLRAAGIPRPDVRITNVYPFWTGPGNPDPTPDQIAAEQWRLEEEIRTCRPKIIATLGRVATQWFLGPDATIEHTHGIPHFSTKAPGAMILPTTHPAAGFYEPARAAHCQDDLMRLAYYIHHPVKDTQPPKIRVRLVRRLPDVIEDAAVDTEGLEDRAWGLSWSHDGITTYVYIWDGKPITTVFRNITFHNAPHDLKILRAMGVDTTGLKYDDTMVALYNLGLEPQGLKSASYRHLGLKMDEFDDVVRPHFTRVALDYLNRAVVLPFPKPRPIPVEDYTKKKYRLYKPQSAQQRIKNIITSYHKKSAERAAGIEKGNDDALRLERKWRLLEDVDPPGCILHGPVPEYQAEIECRMKESFPDFSIFHVPTDQAVQYSGIDAAATALLKPKVMQLVKERGLEKVYDMDRRALPFVDRMQEVGLRVNKPKLMALEDKLSTIREQCRRSVQSIVGDRWFNPGSDEQVHDWLYRTRGIPVTKWTDGGKTKNKRGSTSATALKMIRGYYGKEHPEIDQFTRDLALYRETDKYLGTFVEPIFYYMRRDRNGDWRIHPNFRVTRVISGRLSSHDPNVLAFPTRTDLGKLIRDCFEAAEGFAIVSCDMSQIELRMMAHLCGDRTMRTSFEDDIDLHSLTASILFKEPLTAYKKGPDGKRPGLQEKRRYVAKTINFAVMYGISPKALLEQLYKAEIFDYDEDQCKGFIRDWFKIYGSVRVFLERLWKQAEKDGFVRDMWGRICYVPNLRVGDDQMREAARRLAGNMPVQGGAHGLVKRSEITLHEWIEESGFRDQIRPWLQMHDELILETWRGTDDRFVKGVVEKVQEIMVQDQDLLRIPIKAEGGYGTSWGSAK